MNIPTSNYQSYIGQWSENSQEKTDGSYKQGCRLLVTIIKDTKINDLSLFKFIKETKLNESIVKGGGFSANKFVRQAFKDARNADSMGEFYNTQKAFYKAHPHMAPQEKNSPPPTTTPSNIEKYQETKQLDHEQMKKLQTPVLKLMLAVESNDAASVKELLKNFIINPDISNELLYRMIKNNKATSFLDPKLSQLLSGERGISFEEMDKKMDLPKELKKYDKMFPLKDERSLNDFLMKGVNDNVSLEQLTHYLTKKESQSNLKKLFMEMRQINTNALEDGLLTAYGIRAGAFMIASMCNVSLW